MTRWKNGDGRGSRGDGDDGGEVIARTRVEKDGRTFVQLVNANGPHHNAKVFSEDFIPPALDVRVALRLPARPKESVFFIGAHPDDAAQP